MQQDDFYCRSYSLLNMFREPLCPSSGARDYYTSGCCLSYLVLGFQVVGMVWSWGLCVRFAGCCIMVPETCWASNKISNKNHLLHIVGILFPHISTFVFRLFLFKLLATLIAHKLLFIATRHARHRIRIYMTPINKDAPQGAGAPQYIKDDTMNTNILYCLKNICIRFYNR